jgi:hypothetical protein
MRTGGHLVDHLWLHLSNVGFYPHLPLSRLFVYYEQHFYLLNSNADSSSLDEALHIPNTLMVHGDYLQTSLFPSLLVYHCLAYLDGWSESPFSENFLLCSNEELAGTPSSVGLFALVSYLSMLWETRPIVCIDRITFRLS